MGVSATASSRRASREALPTDVNLRSESRVARLMEMSRRLVLVGVMVLVYRGSVTQLVLATVFCAIYLTIQMEVRPSEDHIHVRLP